MGRKPHDPEYNDYQGVILLFISSEHVISQVKFTACFHNNQISLVIERKEMSVVIQFCVHLDFDKLTKHEFD